MKLLNRIILPALLFASLTSCFQVDEGDGQPSPGTVNANLYVSNNVDGNITVLDFTSTGTFFRTLLTTTNDAEGIYFDEDSEQLAQVSRSQNSISLYLDIASASNNASITPSFTTENILISPRDLAVNDNIYVVSDNSDVDGDPDTDDGRFFLFIKNGNSLTLRNTITVDFKVWGIEFVGDDLFAVVDTTNEIAQFEDFTSNALDVTLAPTKRVFIEGITRTHGIAYGGSVMVLTDIGEATGTGADTDGAFHVIPSFLSKFNGLASGETIPVTDQSRVSGAFTQLGNPVAAEFDPATNTVIIAERANEGGRVLFFEGVGTGGNLVPNVNIVLAGASSLYFAN